VAFSTSQAGDLTGATILTVDFYNSSPLTFTGSVILKQGPSWNWLKSPEIALKPGWNKNILFDLTSLNPKTDLKQAAIVFETKQSGEGFLYMDNLRLTGADPDKVIRYTTADRVTGTPVLVTGFEDGNCPFAPEKDWSSAIDTDVKLVQTAKGTHAAFFYFDNKSPDDRGSFVLQADMDLTAANGTVFDVYVPGKDPMDASLVLNTGAKWEYYESASQTLKPGWNHDVAISLKSHTYKCAASNYNNTAPIIQINAVRKFGLSFASHQIGKSYVVVDNVRLLSDKAPELEKIIRDAVPFIPATEGIDHLLEGFEKGVTPFTAMGGSYKSTGATIVTSKNATEGNHMLKVSFAFEGKQDQAWYGFEQNEAMNLKNSDAVKVDIYNPTKETLTAGMVLKTGDTYLWMEAKPVDCKPGWNLNVTFHLKAKTFKTAASNWQNTAYAENLDQVKSLYIGFYHDTALTGSAYFDNIRITGKDEVVLGKSAAPRGEAQGRSVLWDPLDNPAADGWLAQTSAASNSFAVLSLYTMFQGEHAVDMRYRTFGEDQACQYTKTKTQDWSNVLAVQFDFFNPQPYTVTFTLAVQTGPNFEWQESNEFSLKPGWNRHVRVNIAEPIFKSVETNWASTDFLRTREDIRAIIVSLHPHHLGDGHIVMTNPRTIERDIIGSATGATDLGQVIGITSETQLTVRALQYTLFESFEGDISPWQANTGLVLSRSALYPTDGTHSLEVDYASNFAAGAAVINPVFQYTPPGGKTMDVSGYTHFEFDVYNPGQPLEISMQFYTGPPYNGGSNGEDIESQSVTVFPGWNHNLDISLTGNNFKTAAVAWRYWDTLRNANQVHVIAFKVSGYAGLPGRGTFYMDNLRWVGTGPQKVDTVAGETLSLKINPSDNVQLQVQGSVMGTQNSQAQFNLDKVRLDVRAGGDELALFSGDQLSGSDDPMQLINGPNLGNQVFGVEDHYHIGDVGMIHAAGFAQYGATPNTLGNSSGYMFDFKTDSYYDCWLNFGLVDGRYGNVPGTNPLTSEVEADIKTYEADFNGYLRDIHLQAFAEYAESVNTAYDGSPYFLPAIDNQAYDLGLNYQIGAFKFTAGRTYNPIYFFIPYGSGGASGSAQNNFQIYWATDTFSPIQQMQTWSPFWNDFLSGLNLNIQYYDYSSLTNTNSNYGIRTILTNNTDKSPLNMNFWWYLYDDGYDLGDPSLPNPAMPTRAMQLTSNYELHYRFTPQFLATGIFRDAVCEWWEVFTYDVGLKYKFWGNTWIKGDIKYVDQTGYRFGQYTNIYAGLTKYFMNNAIQASLTYGLPSFLGYWEDDNSLQTLNMLQFSLTGKF
jgi:hypothetical protein